MIMQKVQKAWEEYLHSSTKYDVLKSKKLDKFLLLFHEHISTDTTINFSKMQGVSNILSGEFLVDVHTICSDADGADGAEKLEHYLLHGRGCIILRVLNTIGVTGLSSGRELSELLLSILPLCLKFSRKEHYEKLPDWEVPELHKCFSPNNASALQLQRRRHSSKFPQVTEMSSKKATATKSSPTSKEQGRKSRRLTPLGSFLASTVKSALKTATFKQESFVKPSGMSSVAGGVLSNTNNTRLYQSGSETTESDSENNVFLPMYNNVGNNLPNQNRLGVFRGVLSANTSDNNDGLEQSQSSDKWQKGAVDDMDLIPLPKFDVDPVELCHLILNIITGICQDDSRQLELASNKHVCFDVLPQLANLVTLVHNEGQSSDDAASFLSDGWSVIDYLQVERLLIRVILAGMFSLGIQGNGVVQLQNTGVLQVLITIGHSHKEYLEEFSDGKDGEDLWKKKLLICSELNEGVFALVVGILKNIAVNPSTISTVLSILKEYAVNYGFKMFSKFISLLANGNISDIDISDQVSIFSSLITELKKVKVSYIHTVKCSKKTHKNCDYSVWKHHHHDILITSSMNSRRNSDSEIYDSNARTNSPNCMISTIVEFLLNSFNKASSKVLRMKILAGIEECGICCCLSPSVLIQSLLLDVQTQTPTVRNYTFTLLFRLLLEQCGGQVFDKAQSQSAKIQCQVCEFHPGIMNDSFGSSFQQRNSWEDSTHHMQTNLYSMSDSAFSSGENSFQLGSNSNTGTENGDKWKCLQDLQQVIFSEDALVSVQAMQHVLKLVCQGNDAVKMQLFQSVFIPILAGFPSSKTEKSTIIEKVPDKVVNYCLNSLPLLLQVNKVFHNFIVIGGIKKLCLFLNENKYRNATCKVLQMMVILEEQFDEMNEKQFNLEQQKQHREWMLHSTGKDEVSDYLNQFSTVSDMDISESSEEKDVCISTLLSFLATDEIDSSFSLQQHRDFTTESHGIVEDRQPLKHENTSKSGLPSGEIICDLWNSANILLIHSHKFKKQFFQSTCPHMAYHHLNECLGYLSKCDCSKLESGVFDNKDRSTEFACKVALLHAVLNICLTCQKNSVEVSEKAEMDPNHILTTLKEHLLHSQLFNSGNSAGFKVVCDLLISCSTGRYLPGDLVQSHAFSIMHLKLDVDLFDDKDALEMSESNASSRESEAYITEQGYEADSEFSPEDRKTAGSIGKNWKEPKNKVFINLLNGLPQPEFCRLVVELLIKHHKKHNNTNIMSHILLKLISIAKLSPHNASSLYSQGIVELLLTGFRYILTSKSPEYQAERRLLLDLFLVLSQHSFLSKELLLYLQLFNESNAPVGFLLNTLTLLARMFQLQPSHILCFPVIKSSQASDLRLTERSISQETLSVSMQVMEQSVNDGSTLARSHFLKGQDMDSFSMSASIGNRTAVKPSTTVSPITCAPVELKLETPPMWPGAQKSFTVTLWGRLEAFKGKEQHDSVYNKQRQANLAADLTSLDVMAKEKPLPPKLKAVLKKQQSLRYWTEQCLHMCSVGNLDLMFEVWIEPESYSLIFRIVSHSGNQIEVMTEGATAHLFEAKKWQHLTITFSDTPHSGKNVVNVSVIIDGCYQKDVTLEYSSRKACSSRSVIYLGHTVSPEECLHTSGSWQMGNLMFFRDMLMTKHSSFHLYTLGPNTVSLSQCDSGEQQSVYSHFITEHALMHSGLSHDVFTGSQSIYLQHLRDKLVVVYSPQHSNIYQQYNTNHATQASATSPSNIGSFTGKFEPNQWHLFQQPASIEACQKTDMAPQRHCGLRVAVEEIGGIGVFLFLVAKVIGNEGSTESDQTSALELLFTLLYNSPQHYLEFTEIGGYSMLAKALSTAKCQLGFKILKVLMDACLTSPIIHFNKSTGQYLISHNTEAVIRDARIIDHILLAWKVWDKASPQVWCMVFECIATLVHVDHPQQAFNVAQLELIRVIEKLTVICLERIQDGYPTLPVQICQCMLTVIQHVISYSTDDIIHHVITVWDFLLLVHPAASAFVFHAPSEFYYKNKWAIEPKKMTSAHSSFTTSLSQLSKDKKSPLDDVSEEAEQFFSEPAQSSFALKPFEADLKNIVAEGEPLYDDSTDSARLAQDQSSSTMPTSDIDLLKVSSGLNIVTSKTQDMEHDKDANNSKKSDISFVNDHFKSPSQMLKENQDSVPENDMVEATKKFYISTVRTLSNAVSLPAYLSQVSKPVNSSKNRTFSSLPNNLSGNAVNDIKTQEEFSSPKHRKNAWNERNRNKSNAAVVRQSFAVDCSSQTSEEDFARVSPENIEMEDDYGEEIVNVMNEELPMFQTQMPGEEEFEGGDLEDDGLYVLCAGLANTIANVLGKLSPDDLEQIIGLVIKPEVLLVLAHHPSKSVRASIIRLLDMYLHRASKDLVEAFLKMNGFHLLANQLHQHKANTEIAEAAFTILCAKPFTFLEELDLTMLTEMTAVQKQSVIPILALLQDSVTDIALCHNIWTHLLKVFENVPGMALLLLEHGLCEVLCNVIHKMNKIPIQYTDLGGDEKEIVWGDLHDFVASIIHKTFSLSGILFYQYLEDLIHLLTTGESFASALYGVNSSQHMRVKTVVCVALQTILNFVDEKLDSHSGLIPGAKSFSHKVGGFLSRLVPIRETTGSTVNESVNTAPMLETWDHLNSLQKYSTSIEDKGSTKSVFYTASAKASKSHDNFLKSDRSTKSEFVDNKKSSFKTVMSKSYDGAAMASSSSGIGLGGANVRGSGSSGSMKKSSAVQFNLNAFTAGVLGKKNEVSQGDLLDRFKKLIALAVDIILYSVPFPVVNKDEETEIDESVLYRFPRSLASFLLRGIIIGMEKKSFLQSLFWQTKDTLRIQFSRLYVHMLSPPQAFATKVFAVQLLANEFKCRDIIKLIININYTGHKLEYYLYQMLIQNVHVLMRPEREEVEELMMALQQCGFSPLRLGSKVSTDKKSAMEEDVEIWSVEHRREQALWLSKTQTAKNRIFKKHDQLSKKVCHSAMEVTKMVNNAQAVERKKFLEHIKRQMTAGLQTKKAWQQLILQLTHERAVWFDEKSYPQSWQLDPTEGPCRVRKRLQRCHLNIKKKFFMPHLAEKRSEDAVDTPLSYLFDEDSVDADSRALIYKLHTSQNIQHTCLCTNVTPSDSTPGALLFGQSDLYFVADEAIRDSNYTQVLLGNKDVLFLTLPQEEIKEIHKRWYQLRDDALEIFMMNGKTCLLSFTTTKERDSIYKLLNSLDLPNLLPNVDLSALQQMWLERKITNYEYLTHLNKMAGRSYNDLMQYPVMPFLISQYTENVLDLEDPNIFRNLTKPIAVQHKSREQKYVENYKWLEHEKQRQHSNPLADPSEYRPEPYHYGSHYSNSGSVLHFLVRLAPFTQMFLSYQDQSFDVPDRTFHSLATSWRLASFESTTDVKELIPEFFYLPEFLCNDEEFNFGLRQNNERVDNIIMPNWCHTPYLFIKINRQALESEYVSQHLPAWIDLVFGCKQTGRAAIDAVNVFHPATYFGVEVDKIVDSLRRNAVKTMIATYGQTPKQLFKSAHPSLAKTGSNSPPRRQHSKGFTRSSSSRSVLSNVKGLKWGSYVGSPDCDMPKLVWKQKHGAPVCNLMALPTGEVFGLRARSCLLTRYSKEKGVTGLRNVDVVWASIVSWGHPESVIRLKNKKDMPYINFMHWTPDEQVTCCTCVPDCRLLFFGSTSGVISVFNTRFNASKASHLQVFGQAQKLYGHSSAISCLHMCKAFSILVSASHDGTCIIWDLNRLSYVHCITDHKKHPVHTVCVSETLGDIATVSHTAYGSQLLLHTVNGKPIASLETSKELILCLAYSSSPEGRSVNAIAGGLSNGIIRLWSSWDLQVICELTHTESVRPIVGLTFTQDNQRLFASAEDGKVMCWEKPGYRGKEFAKDYGFYPYL